MRRVALPAFSSALLLVCLSGCGGNSSSSSGGGSNPQQQIAVSISPGSATVAAGGTQQFSATVTGSTNTAVQWQVNSVGGGSSATGTISSSGLYTAPASLPAATQYTVTAVASADTSKNANAMVTVNPPPSVTISLSPATVTVGAGGTAQFTATVANTTNTAVNWSVDGVAGGNATVGMISASGLYTAPGTAGSHTITGVSAADTTKTASASASVVTISVSPQAATIGASKTQQFTAAVSGITGETISWSVDGVAGGNSSVGIISSSGLYTAPDTTGMHNIGAMIAGVIPAISAKGSVTVNYASPGSNLVVTYHNDDARSGTNNDETTLNTTNVNASSFGKIASYPVDGQIYAQPLYLPNVTIGGQSHNVVYVATENDSVYAFDADGVSTTPLWQKSLGTAQPNSDTEGIKPLLGITSTPVIDTTTGTMYVLAEISGRIFKLHALDVTTGNEKFGGPVTVTGSVAGTGTDSSNGRITLEGGCYQRPGIALSAATNALYLAFGHCSHGWLLAYDKATLHQTGIFNVTPDGAGGGLWNSGGAPAIDDDTGDVYLLAGVDLDDPINTGYNDAFLHFSGADIALKDYFIPANAAFLSDNDDDLGSGAALLLPPNGSSTPNEIIGAGKDGNIYITDRDNLGGYQTTNHVIQTVRSGVSSTDNFFDTPAYWNGNLYFHAENDVLRAFSWSTSTGLMSTSPTSVGKFTLGAHGATVSVSSNGTSDGIVWEIDNSAHSSGGPAILRAYDATNVANELYDSSQSGSRDTAGTALKFTVPTVADGHVFVSTSTELDIYSLLP